MLSSGFGPGFNGPLQIVATLPRAGDMRGVGALREVFTAQRGVTAVSVPVLNPAGDAVMFTAYPAYSPQSPQTPKLLAALRSALARGDRCQRAHLGRPHTEPSGRHDGRSFDVLKFPGVDGHAGW